MKDPFENIVGNHQIKSYFKNMMKNSAVANSFLFTGIEGVGKTVFAESLAKMILKTDCLENHPDFYIYRPEGKLGLHSIPAIRQMCERVYMAPFLGKKKVFVIESADKMLPASANALLKTFEEPSSDTTLILISNQPAKLLGTVVSRCRVVRFSAIAEDEIFSFLINNLKMEEKEAKQAAFLSGGSIGRAIRVSQNESDLIKNELIELLGAKKLKLYSELRVVAKSIADIVEQVKKEEDIRLKNELTKNYQTDSSKSALEHVMREIEGAVAIRQSDFAFSIFEFILSWTRDLHLLKNSADYSYLINKESIDLLKLSLKERKLHSIESVQKMIGEAELQLNRSTSLEIVLENLFLKLGLI